MAVDVVLIVNGRRYSGWKSVRVTRSIESLAGSFALDVSDRWDGALDPWPIVEEDACRVEISGQVVIDGFVDKRSLSIDASSRSLSYSGRDRAAALVDCSATVQGATIKSTPASPTAEAPDPTRHSGASVKWVYHNVDVADFLRAMAHPLGVSVSVQEGMTLRKVSKIDVTPGDKCFETVKRVADAVGVLLVSDGRGGVLVTRAGNARAAVLQQGFNIKAASVDYDATERFRLYLISCQVPGTDETSGEETSVQSSARDLDVKRGSRVILIRPDRGYTTAEARARADWEARIRAARAETVSVTVQGWQQPNGALWPVNALTRVQAPGIGVDGDMLISQVEYSIGDGGQVAKLNLVRPDAFTPEPTAVVSGSSGWKELAKGV